MAALALAAITSFSAPALASETPDARDRTLPCRPTIACTADIVPPGTFDLEAGMLFRRLSSTSNTSGTSTASTTSNTSSASTTSNTSNTSNTRQWTFPFLAKLTLEPWVQLQVGSNGFTAATGAVPENYFDDIIVGPKFHLHDQSEWTPSISVSAEASLPTFRGQGYVRTYDAFFTGYVTKDIGPVHADFNAVWNLWRIDSAPLSQGLVALALTANVPPPFGFMGEAYYFSNAAPVAPRDGGFLFALTHSPRPWLVFDLGADLGWFPSTRAYSLFVGMSIIPVVLWRPRTGEASGAGDIAPHDRPLPAYGSIR